MRGLRILLEAFGIKVNPEEVEQFYERMRIELPAAIDSLKATFGSIDNRLNLNDKSLDEMTTLLSIFNERLKAIEECLSHDGKPALENTTNGKTTPGRK